MVMVPGVRVMELARATLAISVFRFVLKVTIVGSICSFIFGCRARNVTCRVDRTIWNKSQGRYSKNLTPVVKWLRLCGSYMKRSADIRDTSPLEITPRVK